MSAEFVSHKSGLYIPRPERPIIQGGMAVHIQGPEGVGLVAKEGGIGTVALTAAEVIMARKLQLGDIETAKALMRFPQKEIAKRILDKYYVTGGISEGQSFKSSAMWELDSPERWELEGAHHKSLGKRYNAEVKQQEQKELQEEAVAGAFCEVYLAKKKAAGGIVSANAMRKIDLPFSYYLLGAMAAGVDVVTVGAGSPADVPELLNRLATGEITKDRIHVAKEDKEQPWFMTIDPEALLGTEAAHKLSRPPLLAIVSHVESAEALITDPHTRPEGIVWELWPAGGHNAPAIGQTMRNRTVYTERDNLSVAAAKELMERTRSDDPDFFFAIGGGFGNPVGYEWAMENGFDGVQSGTAFALTGESNVNTPTRTRMLDEIYRNGSVPVAIDPEASGSGLPFHVAQVSGTQTDVGYKPACTLGFLMRQVIVDGVPQGRCPAMPSQQFERLGGNPRLQPQGAKEVCRGLFSDVVMRDARTGAERSLGGRNDSPLITLGNDQTTTAFVLRETGEIPTIPGVMQVIENGPKKGPGYGAIFENVHLPLRVLAQI